MADKKFYKQMKLKDRVILKESVLRQKKNFIAQRDLLERSLMAAQRERILLVDRLLKEEVDIAYYVKRQEFLHNYINKFFIATGKLASVR
jgi:hypothetical protein